MESSGSVHLSIYAYCIICYFAVSSFLTMLFDYVNYNTAVVQYEVNSPRSISLITCRVVAIN
jgi:hypothetical protein